MSTPSRPTQLSVDEVQGVWDALDAFMAGADWITANAGVSFDGARITHTMTCNDRTNINSFNLIQGTQGTRVNVSPASALLSAGQTQQFTASAVDAAGVAIPGAVFTWALSGSMAGSVDASGLYTAPAVVSGPAQDLLTVTLDAQSWTTVSIQLQ